MRRTAAANYIKAALLAKLNCYCFAEQILDFAPNNLYLLYERDVTTEKKLGCHSKIFINTTKCIDFFGYSK